MNKTFLIALIVVAVIGSIFVLISYNKTEPSGYETWGLQYSSTAFISLITIVALVLIAIVGAVWQLAKGKGNKVVPIGIILLVSAFVVYYFLQTQIY